MKKIFAIAMILIVAFGAFAGGASESGAAAAASGDTRPTIRLLTDATGIDDKSFNAAAWRGILEYYGDASLRGQKFDVVTAATQDMYIPNLMQAADEGYDVICVTGFTWADALIEVAQDYPNQHFMIVDVDWCNQPNIKEFIYKEEQGSYLVGLVAAYQAQADGIENPSFGFIGGVPGATITKFEMGYIQGILSVYPNARIYDYYVNSWGAPELAKAQAKNWYDSGVYCIFSAAGGSGLGAIAQAREYRMAGRNVWAIGVDSDQFEDGLYDGTNSAVLTSMVKLVENSVLMTLREIEAGNFTGGRVEMTLADGGVGYTTTNPALKDEVKAKVDAVAPQVASGAITVYGKYRDALAAGAVPAGLSAIDD